MIRLYENYDLAHHGPRQSPSPCTPLAPPDSHSPGHRNSPGPENIHQVITWHFFSMPGITYVHGTYVLSLDLHNDADLDAGGVHQGGVKELGGAARLVLSPTLCGPGARAVLHKGSDERLD